MNGKVLHTLEYDKVLEQLAAFAISAPAKRMCSNLRPSQDLPWIERAQEQTADALKRLIRSDHISFSSNEDMRELLKTASLGRTLSMAELLGIARLLQTVSGLQEYEADTVEKDSLSEMFLSLDSLPALYKDITHCILSEDTMADNASSELARIRGSYSVITGRIHSQLNHMVNGATRSYLQDAVITMRGDRYCLPVKSEYRSQVPGIIHDQSSTGSTLFIEPSSVVEMNNRLSQLHIDEQKEIERILSALSAKAGQNADIINNDQKTVTILDFIFARGKYALRTGATRPVFNTGHRITLRKARHPMLDPSRAVPIDIRLGDEYNMLIITGPNTGGKTVSLKTLGLLSLMGQAGMHIPALERSELSLFKEIFADIGDEQSIEQSLSTFSSHMTGIVQILKKADKDSLCLFDELGAGTDPTEGAALANAILDHLHQRHIRTMATTHYSELKIYALTTDGVENAACEFDVETLSPTYRLLIGVPGKSNAFAISKKLGLSEDIIGSAGNFITQEQESFENVIANLEDQRVRLERREEELNQQREALDKRQKAIEAKEEQLNSKKTDLLMDAREEARDILKEAKDVADETIRAFHNLKSPMKIQTMEKKRRSVREQISRQDEAIYKDTMKRSAKARGIEEPEKMITADNATEGTPVHVKSLGIDGIITSPPGRDGLIEVRCGIITTRVKLSDLLSSDGSALAEERKQPPKNYATMSKSSTVSAEINVIGCTVDEATTRLDKYLDDVSLSSLNRVRIVHGKGSGALKAGIHAYLKTHPSVESFTLAEHGEGDAGVTVVTMK